MGETPKREWQPVRIAPISDWHKKLRVAQNWAYPLVGKVVRVSVDRVKSTNLACNCELHELHPHDRKELVHSAEHEGFDFLDARECQILAD